jgi:hypothetical protein
MAKNAPWLTGIGVFGAAPWFINEHRPAAEYCSVQCVDLHDIAGIIIYHVMLLARYPTL